MRAGAIATQWKVCALQETDGCSTIVSAGGRHRFEAWSHQTSHLPSYKLNVGAVVFLSDREVFEHRTDVVRIVALLLAVFRNRF